MAGLDWLVIAIYFLIMAAIVLWSSKKQNTSADYFLAGRNIGWFAIGGSLFASNIGSEHIVGLAGSGAMSGMAMAHWEMHAWIMLMLGWIFVPFYYKANVFTMPEFLEKRFNKYVRWILTVVSLVAYVFTKISVTVYAGALVFQTILPDININLFGYTKLIDGLPLNNKLVPPLGDTDVSSQSTKTGPHFVQVSNPEPVKYEKITDIRAKITPQ